MKYLFLVICVATLGSCSTIYPLADRELDYKLDKLWLEYKDMTNNELAMYLALVEESVSISVRQCNYTLMGRLIDYKLAIDDMLKDRLKQKLT